ncbi:MAG: recombinase family protein [Roseburia intestinalis]
MKIKGLSGYFSDRPDFQRMLHDVQDGKIKAIVCYKLDRSRKKDSRPNPPDGFLEKCTSVNLLICSNGINTASGLYKIFIQIFCRYCGI